MVNWPPPDELWYSTLFLAQKESTNRGHGEALVSYWSNSLGDYQLNHNVSLPLNGRILIELYSFPVFSPVHSDQLPEAGCQEDPCQCWSLWEEDPVGCSPQLLG